VLLASFWTGLLQIILFLIGVVLIGLVLIQRGRGGGLVGALGGTGGSSPFGSRAGDMFTRVTLGLAVAWIVLNMVMGCAVQPPPENSAAPAASEGPPPANQ
jgi:preprotein translocase subunit SecG